jgi:hypothetical protein
MAGFENKNTFDDGLTDDGLKTIPVGAAVGGLPVSAEVGRDGHEILGRCARQEDGRSVGAVKGGDTRDVVRDPENVCCRVDGQAPGVYEVRISAIGDTCYITLKIFPGESVTLLIFTRSHTAEREEYE